MSEDWDAWKTDEPPPSFADRVVKVARADVGLPRNGRPLRIAAGVLLVFAVALGVLLSARLGSMGRKGAMHATSRRELRIGGRAVAVLEPGADVTWDGTRTMQSSGDVFWRVEPGGPFVVSTPGGEIRVMGTCFRVKVLAGKALGAAIVVSVFEGRVVLARDGSSVDLAAGQMGEASAKGVVMKGGGSTDGEGPELGSPAEHAVAMVDRMRADRMREDLGRLLLEHALEPTAPEPSAAGSPEGNSPTMPVSASDAGETVDPSYLQGIIQDEFRPLARHCYDAARAKNPALEGKVVLEFRILSDPSVGGVVSAAKLGDGTTIADHEMRTCIEESMMSVTFAAPPHGGELDVRAPMAFTQRGHDGGS